MRVWALSVCGNDIALLNHPINTIQNVKNLAWQHVARHIDYQTKYLIQWSILRIDVPDQCIHFKEILAFRSL